MNGISVTTHWTGTNENLYGGYGQIWRHDIVNDAVTRRTLLYDGKARNPVIDPGGTMVAFVRKDHTVCVMSVDGGTVQELAEGHGEGCLDFPTSEWIYFNKGGFDQPQGSLQLYRVDPRLKKIEHVVDWAKGIWRYGISNDLQRAAVRPNDSSPRPKGCITAYDMIHDEGVFHRDRSTKAANGFRCCTGISPNGRYIMIGNREHTGTEIAEWDNFESVACYFLNRDAQSWGPDTTDSGESHNRNTWATNSEKWVCIHHGWGERGTEGANQVLINWVDKKRICVTDNTEGSKAFDCCGDLWVAKE